MPEARAAETGARVRRRCVLLVEDVEAMRLYLRCVLESQGLQVVEAGDLDTARRLLSAGTRPTSILLDL